MPDPIYAIGDIHGHDAELQRVLALIEADGGPDAHIVFLGDYVDRGPDSRAVIACLSEAAAQGRNWTMLKGNHDRFFSRFLADGQLEDPATREGLTWLDPVVGGKETLLSYGVEITPDTTPDALLDAARAAIPDTHRRFLETRPATFATDDLFFVHAGIRPGVPLDQQSEDDLLWIRRDWLSDRRDHGPLIVHGHTALDHPTHHGNRVNLDGGAGYARPLHAAVFEGREGWLLGEDGRHPIPTAD